MCECDRSDSRTLNYFCDAQNVNKHPLESAKSAFLSLSDMCSALAALGARDPGHDAIQIYNDQTDKYVWGVSLFTDCNKRWIKNMAGASLKVSLKDGGWIVET